MQAYPRTRQRTTWSTHRLWHPVGPTSFLCHINDHQPESQRLHTFVTTIISKRLFNPSTKSKTTNTMIDLRNFLHKLQCHTLQIQQKLLSAVYRYSFLLLFLCVCDHQLKHFGSVAIALRHRTLYGTNLSQMLHCAALQHRHSFFPRTIKASLFIAWLWNHLDNYDHSPLRQYWVL